MPPRTVSRAIAVLILSSAALTAVEFFSEFEFSRAFSMFSAFLLFSIFLPYFLVAVGAASLFTDRQFGYILIYIGFVLSPFGFYWLYVPFFSLPFEPLTMVVVTMLGINGVIVAVLAWCHVKERSHASTQNAA